MTTSTRAIRNMSGGEAWESFVGRQSVDEFTSAYAEMGISDVAEMVGDYVADLNRASSHTHSDEELGVIAEKLAEYIRRQRA